MKNSFIVSPRSLQVLAAIFCLGNAAHAENKGPVKVTAKPNSGAVVLDTPKPLSAYEQLRAGSKAPRVTSLNQIRENHTVFAGRTVEFKGQVAGLMSTNSGRRVLVRCETGSVADGTTPDNKTVTTSFEITPNIQDDDESMRALRPGAQVRLLASVNPQMDEPLVTLLAATDTPEAAPLFRDDNGDNSDIIIVPPMTAGGLPLPRKVGHERAANPARRAAPKCAARRSSPQHSRARIMCVKTRTLMTNASKIRSMSIKRWCAASTRN